MSGIAYCKYKKYNYIHTPFKQIYYDGDIKSLNNFIGIPDLLSRNDITKTFSTEVH